MAYVDCFVLPVQKDKLDAYKHAATQAESLFREYGATAYVECVADGVTVGELTSFPRAVMAQDDEIVVISWVVYPSKDIRDAAQQKVMTDPRMMKAMENMPVDGKRMIFGGFKPLLGL